MAIEITSQRGKAMSGYLDKSFYENSIHMRSLHQAEGVEFDKVNEAIRDVLNQFYVRTATWSLNDREKELGLTPAPNLPTAQRQDRIVSKLRGYGTATIALVKNVAQAYERGNVDIIEDFAASTIIVKFADTKGIPANIDDLKAAVREVVPANLAIMYAYRYLLVKEVRSMTVGQMQQQKINNFSFGGGE